MVSHKRLMALILMLALVLPVLAACGGGNTGSPATAVPGSGTGGATAVPGGGTGGNAPGSAGASGDVTRIQVEEGADIRIVVNGNPTEQQLYQDGVKRFNEVFPNVKVTVEVNTQDYETKMKAAFAAGTGPDVLLLPPQLLGAFGPEGLLLPLDEAMVEAGAQKTDYVDSLISLFTIENQTLGLPKDFNPLVVFVNSDIAQQAGVDPATIKTWDDLKAASQKMTSGEGASKVYGMCLNPDIQRVGAAFLQNNNPMIQDGKAVFNNEQGVAALDYWYSFKTDGSGELFKQLGKNWCGEALASKVTAMAVEGGWLVPFMADPNNNATDVKYTAIPLPTPADGKPATWVFTNAFGVNARTKFPKAAAALAIFLTSANNQKALIPSGLAQPTIKELINDPYYQQNPVAKVLVEQGRSGFSVDETLGGPTRVGDVVGRLNQAVEAVFLGQTPTRDALNQAARDIEPILGQ
ncbi:MAG: ABC transporter substrate-binding protein [Roseiflexaceae bacterium]